MKIDVSEIKAFKACRRQWQLSSRNKFHMRPRVTPPQFNLGTIFHEALHQLYLGVSLEKVMTMVKKEMMSDSDVALLAMIPGYAREVLPDDLDRFHVLDIEHKFSFVPADATGELLFPDSELEIVGSIDMIAIDHAENKIYGFEHKTAKSFRDESYLWMDEQPRLYTYALQQYVDRYNATKHKEWLAHCEAVAASNVAGTGFRESPEEPEPATLGGIYLNEVKKLLRSFQYHRVLCKYDDEDMDNFLKSFYDTCLKCEHAVATNGFDAPNPSYFNCQMCSFKTICATYMYSPLNKEAVLKEFEEEFVERTEDHLEEKSERKADD